MKMKQIANFIFLIMLSLFVISACSSSGGGNNNSTPTTSILNGATINLDEGTITDSEGNIIAYINEQGTITDTSGNVIGNYNSTTGAITDTNGNTIGSVSSGGSINIVDDSSDNEPTATWDDILSAFSSEFILHFKYGENSISEDNNNAITNIQYILTTLANNGVASNITNTYLATTYGKMVAEYINNMGDEIVGAFYGLLQGDTTTFPSLLENYLTTFSDLTNKLKNIDNNADKIKELANSLMGKLDTEYEIAKEFYNAEMYIKTVAENYYNSNNNTKDEENEQNAVTSFETLLSLIGNWAETYQLEENLDLSRFREGDTVPIFYSYMVYYCNSHNTSSCVSMAQRTIEIMKNNGIVNAPVATVGINIANIIYTYLYIYLSYEDSMITNNYNDPFYIIVSNASSIVYQYIYSNSSYNNSSSVVSVGGNMASSGSTSSSNVSSYYTEILNYASIVKQAFAELSSEDTQGNIRKNAYYLVTSLLDYINNDDFAKTLYNSVYIYDVLEETTEFSINDYLGLFD